MRHFFSTVLDKTQELCRTQLFETEKAGIAKIKVSLKVATRQS